MRSRPDLVVPVRDRRQRKRYLTLKNLRNALIVLVVIAAGLTAWSAFHGKKTDGYGRLVATQVGTTDTIARKAPPTIVQEAPINDQTAVDPLLVTANARAQILGGTSSQLPEPVPQTSTGVGVMPPSLRSNPGHGVSIVGGAEGVTLVRPGAKPVEKPLLQGGVFRPQ